jgi:hypothetical protein
MVRAQLRQVDLHPQPVVPGLHLRSQSGIGVEHEQWLSESPDRLGDVALRIHLRSPLSRIGVECEQQLLDSPDQAGVLVIGERQRRVHLSHEGQPSQQVRQAGVLAIVEHRCRVHPLYEDQ